MNFHEVNRLIIFKVVIRNSIFFVISKECVKDDVLLSDSGEGLIVEEPKVKTIPEI